MPSASVIVRFRNHASTLPLVLDALKRQSLAHELIGVDSGSTDGSTALLDKQTARIVSVPPRHFSYGRALNDGAAAASGEYLVFLSAHSVPDGADALEALVAPLSRPSVVGSYGRQRPFPDMNPFEARILREYYGPLPRVQSDDPRFSNAWSAVRRDVWVRHRFNEVVPGAEDQHWAHEVQRHGFAVAYVPEAQVIYHQQFGIRDFYDRALRLGFAAQALRRGPLPRLHQSLFSAGQMVLQDVRAWREDQLALRWLLRSPSFRLRQSLGLRRGARMASRVLDWR